jgi:hypothetical protein
MVIKIVCADMFITIEKRIYIATNVMGIVKCFKGAICVVENINVKMIAIGMDFVLLSHSIRCQ